MTESIREPLAEIEFNLRGTENARTYCLCSRAFIRSKIKKNSWEEVLKEKLENCRMVREPKTSPCNPERCPMESFKKQEVETVSCYCSASHYSTDDYESVVQSNCLDQHSVNKDQIMPCPLQNSDSGADLSENFTEKPLCMVAEKAEKAFWKYSKSRLETAWEKYWSENGEGIIWKSWIEKYGAYINPNYLEQNSFCESIDVELNTASREGNGIENENKISLVGGVDDLTCEIKSEKGQEEKRGSENLPILKISSFPSSENLSEAGGDVMQINKYMDESDADDIIIKSNSFGSYASYEKLKCDDGEEKLRQNDYERVRSRCSNTNLSLKSIANTTVTTDSMTNVTKITLSSLDLSYEECASVKSSSLLSSCSEDSSGSQFCRLSSTSSSSSSSSSSSNSSKEEICTEADVWWKKVWKEHYENQYESSYRMFARNFDNGSEETKLESKVSAEHSTRPSIWKKDEEENGAECGGNSICKTREYLNSVGYLLSKLDAENLQSQEDKSKKFDDDDDDDDEDDEDDDDDDDDDDGDDGGDADNGGDEVPKSHKGKCDGLKRQLENSDDSFDELDETCKMKRSHNKREDAERLQKREKLVKKMDNIKQAMALMGFSFKPNSMEIQSGHVTYRKRNIRGQNRRLKLCDAKPRSHLFFDDDGMALETNPHDSVPVNLVLGEPSQKLGESLLQGEPGSRELESLGYEAHSSSIEDGDGLVDESKKQRRRRKRQRKYCIPQEILDNKNLLKYWFRRYQLFSKFDSGIRLDAESWYSVTPEQLAKHHAERCRCDIIVDAFCGAGGNSIQFAFTCERVIAIDIDPFKIEMAKHNAKIYGVEERIEFIVGDFVKLASNLQADVVFLSPPWGGPNYTNQDVYGLDGILPPLGGRTLFHLACAIANDVAYFLPKNANSSEIALLSGPGGEVEIEQNFLDRRLRSVTAYFGGLITDPSDTYPNNT